jgi:hypothetical protein
MARWLLKSAVQRTISWLPNSQWWNGLFQRYVTGGLRLAPHGEFRGKLLAAARHHDYYRLHSRQPAHELRVLEIGTGWFPIIPIAFYLLGASSVHTFDIVRLVRRDTFRKTLDCFQACLRDGELLKILTGIRPGRLARFQQCLIDQAALSPEAFLARLDIHYSVSDFTSNVLPSASFDYLFTHGVLEHLPGPVLSRMLAQFHRLSLAGSVMGHYIGLQDQFSQIDRSITPFHNLQFSSRAWRWLDSPLIPQNRFRIADYRRFYRDAGFEIVAEDNTLGSKEDLDRVRLAPEFRHHSSADLLVRFSWLVGRPAPSRDDL